MGRLNGHANDSSASHLKRKDVALPAALPGANTTSRFTPEQIEQFVAQLEVPFDPSVIEWRVTSTGNQNGRSRGLVIPYADQRAYTDRLNALFSPAGWTRKYIIHTSANFQRGKDQKTTAKVFVTCDLTIFGLGSHSATGEEWTDNDNAGTSAEAQAFKRACSCFGLGRYLYHFTGIWVEVDERKRAKGTPKLPGWATPEGWRQGLRPQPETDQGSWDSGAPAKNTNTNHEQQQGSNQGECLQLTRQVEAMAEPLGKGLYRGLLKTVARAWKPSDILDVAVLQNVLTHMQAADRGLRRLEAALDKTGPEALAPILRSLNLKSLDQLNSLDILQKLLLAVEARADDLS